MVSGTGLRPDDRAELDGRQGLDFLIKCDGASPRVVCYLMGNLEQGAAARFRRAVAQITDKQEVIFELSAVPFVGRAGLGALIGKIRRVHDDGGEAVVCAARPSVGRVFNMIGLSRIVPIVNSFNEAQEYLSSGAIG